MNLCTPYTVCYYLLARWHEILACFPKSCTMKKKTSGSKTSRSTPGQPQPTNKPPRNTDDLTDSPEDEANMQEEPTTLDLPDVQDIPGQEHIRAPRMREYADTTISSDDEEGATVLDNPRDEDIIADAGSNVSVEEAALLQEAAEHMPDPEEERLRNTALDSTDEDGDPLNEKGFSNAYNGSDLDVPGSEEDDANEAIGEEDEENNPYSVDDENEDDER